MSWRSHSQRCAGALRKRFHSAAQRGSAWSFTDSLHAWRIRQYNYYQHVLNGL